jgi:hypothetical protein
MPRKVEVRRWIAKMDRDLVSEHDADYTSIDNPDYSQVSVPMALDMENQEGSPIVVFSPSTQPGPNNAMYESKLFWVARYKDNSFVTQGDGESEKSTEDLSRENLRVFTLEDVNGRRVFAQELRPGWQFFYRRRTAMQPGAKIEVLHVVGWRVPYEDDFLTHVAFVYEDDFSVVLGDLYDSKRIEDGFEQYRHPVAFVEADLQVIS